MRRLDSQYFGAVFEKLIEPTLIQPTFVTHLPKELVSLAKLSLDDPPARTKPLRRGEGPTTVEVFESRRDSRKLARHEVSG